MKANGPIAIIFNYVHAWGAEIDEHFWFQDVGQTRVNIRHGLIQTVEQAITRAISKHAISKAEARRKRIDWTLILADINEHHKDDQTTLRAIMSAGLWDKHLLHKAGLAMDSRCD